MMKEKIKYKFYPVINSVILAGMILFFIGLYYWMIKAGIPYQDPPLELQIQYAINTRIGEILLANGFIITVCGGIIRLFFKLIEKRYQKK